MMDPSDVSALITAIRKAQMDLTEEERKELWAAILEGYCRECGRLDPGHRCRCWDDE